MAQVSWPRGRVKTKLLPHKHSGRLRSHQHTSYGGLLAVVFLAMLPILFAQRTVVADTSYGVYSVIPSALPTKSPQINNVPDGKVFTANDSLNLTGTCQNDTQVKIFKNEVLAGSTLCKGGAFSLSFDLFLGQNQLTARAYNVDNIAGPESSPISVKLVPPNVPTGSKSSTVVSSQFFMTSDAYYRGASSGKAIVWLIKLDGGTAPYVVDISWGDGKTETVGRGTPGQFKISHIYASAPKDGSNYNVVLQAQDQQGAHALLQLVAVIPAGAVAGATSTTNSSSFISGSSSAMALQSLGTATLIVLSFWIGERYEMRALRMKSGTPA